MRRLRYKLANLGPWLRENYHWVVVVVMFLMLFTHGGSLNNLSSLHIAPVTEELGISRSEYSLGLMGKTIFGMLSTFFSGAIIARFGSRLVATVGMVMSIVAFTLLACVQNIWMLFIAGSLLGFTYGFCSTSAAACVSRAWFHHHGGTVLGLITAATGIGGSVLCLIQTPVMQAFSFRASYLVSAISIAAILVLVALFVRNRPEDKGLKPYGEGEETIGRRRRSIEVSHPGLPMKTLWTRPAFRLTLLSTLLFGFGVYTAYITIPSHLQECGLDTNLSSALWSGMLLALTATKFLAGLLCDKFGARRVNVVTLLIGVAGLLLLLLAKSPTAAVISMVLYAAALPLVSVIPPLVAFSMFGYRGMSGYTGVLLALITVGSFVAELISGVIHDTFGTYHYVYVIGAACCALAAILFVILYPLADKDLTREDAQ